MLHGLKAQKGRGRGGGRKGRGGRAMRLTITLHFVSSFVRRITYPKNQPNQTSFGREKLN